MIKKGLGKGLGALITSADSGIDSNINELRINDIEPNVNQPRKHFNDEKLIQLSESIKQHGIMQPIIAKKEDNIDRIVAGERRWRAARIAGFKTVPVIIKELTNKEVMEIALIENLQREDLNSIEEAEAYDKLIKEYNMTQDELSKIIGKSRPAIANSLRLLNLNDKIKGFLISGDITSGHARAILAIEDKEIQMKAALEIIEKNLNVRETESLVKKILTKKELEKNIIKKSEEFVEIEEKLKNIFGTKVEILKNNKKGRIMIEYYSNEDLDRLLDLIGNINEK